MGSMHRSMRARAFLALAVVWLPAEAQHAPPPDLPQAGDSPQDAEPAEAARAALAEAFAAEGLVVDLEAGWCALPAAVEITEDLLEYVLVGPGGAGHESLFSTPVRASVLNTALLALGVERGTNASWSLKDPPPSAEQLAAGVSAYDVRTPAGDGFYLYAGWSEDGETYFFRVEDLLRNFASGRSMRRHAWVYLGSTLVPDPANPAEQQIFAADVYRNLVNVSFFSEGYTLVTGALEECLLQTIWAANAWLVPPRGSSVRFFFAREPIDGLPAPIAELLPAVGGEPEAPPAVPAAPEPEAR